MAGVVHPRSITPTRQYQLVLQRLHQVIPDPDVAQQAMRVPTDNVQFTWRVGGERRSQTHLKTTAPTPAHHRRFQAHLTESKDEPASDSGRKAAHAPDDEAPACQAWRGWGAGVRHSCTPRGAHQGRTRAADSAEAGL